jgi:hypothetical protein
LRDRQVFLAHAHEKRFGRFAALMDAAEIDWLAFRAFPRALAEVALNEPA